MYEFVSGGETATQTDLSKRTTYMELERLPTRLVKPANAESKQLAQATTSAGDGHERVALSKADLAIPPMHVPILFAYAAAPTWKCPGSGKLEATLAEVLCEYREWAGRLITHNFGPPDNALSERRVCIELNDEGVAFVEARSHAPLSHLWPFLPSDDRLLHLLPDAAAPQRSELLAIQVTKFECGGLTIGISFNHQVADGEALFEFLNAWASKTQGILPIITSSIVHDRSSLYARRTNETNITKVCTCMPASWTNEGFDNLTRRRLHFSFDKLKAIKDLATQGAPRDVTYSTFVSLLAHFWKCALKAQSLDGEEEMSRITLTVSLRGRFPHLLPKGFFGNGICHVFPQVKIKDLVNEPLFYVASHLDAAIRNVGGDKENSNLDFIEPWFKELPPPLVRSMERGLTQHLFVTSWLSLPLYELDFGWGKPLHAGYGYLRFDGLVICTRSKDEMGGIDVDIALAYPHMEKLEALCFNV